MNYLEKTFQWEIKTDVLIILTITIVSLILTIDNVFFWHIHLVYLNESQILNIFSVLSQIVGGFIGISVAAYALLDSRFNSIIESDDTLKEIILFLRKNQFRWLLRLVIGGLINVTLCLSTISIYIIDTPYLFDLLSDFALISFAINIYCLIKFILFLSPNALSLQSNIIKKDIEKDYTTKTKPASFAEFVTKYNQFEDLLYSFIDDEDYLPYQYGSAIPRTPKRKNIRIDDALRSKGIFNNCLVKIYNDIRKYRNALVHGTDDNKEVNAEINNRLLTLYDLLNKLLQYTKKNPSDFKNSSEYQALIEYSLDNVLSNTERDTLNVILKYEHSTNSTNRVSKINTRGFTNMICNGIFDDLVASDRITKEEYSALLNYYSGIKKTN